MKAPAFFYRHAGLGSLLGTLSNATALFLIFRLGYRHLGGPVMGLWALIQGIMLFSRLSDLGSAGNITRLVAIERINNGEPYLRNFVTAGLLVSTGSISLLGLMIVGPTYWYAKARYADVVGAFDMLALVWSSFLFGIILSAGSVLSGCLDGSGLMALRGYLTCIANIFLVGMGYVFILRFGGAGLGALYVAYSLILVALFAVAILLFGPRRRPDRPVADVMTLVRASFSFNLSFVVVGICRLMLDPISKFLISAFSTLDQVAFFDLANKFGSQTIVLFSSITQSVLPHVSRESREIDETLREKFIAQNIVVMRSAFCAMTMLVLLSEPLSLFLLGHIVPNYVFIQMILALGGAINTAGLIGYYMEVGSGHLRRLILVFLSMVVANIALGVVLGELFGAIGVATGFSAALAVGGVLCARSMFRSAAQMRLLLSWTAVEGALFFLMSGIVWYLMVTSADLPLWAWSCVISVCAALTLGIFLYRGGAKFLLGYIGKAQL